MNFNAALSISLYVSVIECANSNLNMYVTLCSAHTTADDGNYAKYFPLFLFCFCCWKFLSIEKNLVKLATSSSSSSSQQQAK